MIDPVALLAFVPAALALNLTPGADMMFCLGQGIRGGPRAALAASAGVAAGGMVHVSLAGMGLGAAVATLPWLFDLIRWIGVGYLLWLAWAALTTRPRDPSRALPAAPGRRAFRTGLVVSLTNPKVILFVLAFVPQFVVPEAGPILGQFLVFGAVLSVGGFVINGAVGIGAGRLGSGLTHPRAALWLSRISGMIFAGLAVRLAVLERV
ncbi:MAG: LysE family translocator [Rhodobacteraceae bacterium]|nr:LysE family translocator [Paracoccaceae bacterium]